MLTRDNPDSSKLDIENLRHLLSLNSSPSNAVQIFVISQPDGEFIESGLKADDSAFTVSLSRFETLPRRRRI